ncbi:MAG: phytanoyl-CoA dioxygenase family protein [Alphaproteobacteria bacterium]
MGKVLTDEQVKRYRHDNFLFPIPALSLDEVAHYRRCLEAYEAEQGGAPLPPPAYRKLHVREPWAAELIRHPKVLDAVEDVLGPDILAFNATFFIKQPHTPHVTAWHQDSTYFGLDPHEHVTAWVALSEASELAGCMRFLPGSSQMGQLHHAAKQVAASVNHGSQTLVQSVDENQALLAPIKAGEMSFHHTLAVHASGPNNAEDRRIGWGISYIPAHVRHVGSYRMGATLVRGVDRYGHFELEPDPREHDAAFNAVAHDAAYKRYREGYDEQIVQHRTAFGG